MAKRKKLKGLTTEAFVADTDKLALDKLKKVPLLPAVLQQFYEHGIDRWMYLINMGYSVRCGPNQYKTLYNILRESCEILDMPEPELYITSNPYPNAWAGGVERPYITLRCSIVEALTDEELYHLIGHELGHVKADHVLYMSVASVLVQLLDLIGRRTFGLSDAASIALVLAMYEWYRQAEITADRAGLLVAQSLDLSIDANVALTAGPSRLRHEMTRQPFIDQAKAYQDATGLDAIGKMIVFLFISSLSTHPIPVYRTQKLIQWAESGAYDRIMAGDYSKVGAGV